MQKKELIDKLYHKQKLTLNEAEQLMLYVTEGQFTEIELAIMLMYYKMNAISIDELSGFRNVLLNKSLRFSTPFETIDVCGTGGDGKNTINISTLSAIVIAACGYKVVKHGNYGVSSLSGSSNVLEYLGYQFSNDPNLLNEQLEQSNICFLHAPLFHPALKNVAPVRKTFASHTVFNLLGPLVNPCNIAHQYIGVNSLETMRTYEYLLQKTNVNFCLVHSLDGYDEISLTNTFKVVIRHKIEITHPLEINFPLNSANSLLCGESIKEAAEQFIKLLNDEATIEQKNAVIINSAYAIQLINQKPIEDCILEAKESIESKKALRLFKQLINKTYEYIN